MPFHRASAGTTAFTAVHHGDRIHRRPVERYPPRPRHHQDLLTAEVASGDGVITGLVVRRRCGGDRVKRVEWCAGRGGAIYPLCASYGRWLRPTGSIILPSRAARIILKETLSLSLSLSHTDAIREKSVERPLALTFLSLSLSLPLDESLTVEKHWFSWKGSSPSYTVSSPPLVRCRRGVVIRDGIVHLHGKEDRMEESHSLQHPGRCPDENATAMRMALSYLSFPLSNFTFISFFSFLLLPPFN
ncbi:uncharacterized protein LOC116261995 [Nymphaea colorata]|nr:uncharacterized protein LOC116261995 [Nymphaea colorata]